MFLYLHNCSYFINIRIRRYLHYKTLKTAKALDFKPVQNENNYVHEALEHLPAYENHVIPHPTNFIHSYKSSKSSFVRDLLKNECLESGVTKSFLNVDMYNLFENSEAGKRKQLLRTETSNPNENLHTLIHTFKRRSLLNFTQTKNLDDLKWIRNLIQEVQFTSDDELARIMFFACSWTSIISTNFRLFNHVLDIQCCKRFLNWTVDRQLMVADTWYHFNKLGVPKYYEALIENVPEVLHSLTISQLIHILFIINLKRNVDSDLMKKIECRIEGIINLLSTEEIAVIAMSFFKTSTKLSSSVITRLMIEHLMEAMDSVNPVMLTCVVKCLRHSFRYENKDMIESLLKKAAQYRVWQSNSVVGPHLCLLAVNHNAFVPDVLNSIVEDMLKLKYVRLKDITQILLTVTKYNHLKKDADDAVIEYFKRELHSPLRNDEIRSYPLSFLSSIVYMAYMNIFLRQEINVILSHKFYKVLKANSREEFCRLLAVLDCLVEMDDPMYTGYRLDPHLRQKYLQPGQLHYPTTKHEKTFREKIIMDIWGILRNIVNLDVALVHVLPYMDDPVFLLVIDRNGNCSMPPVDTMKRTSEGKFVKCADERTWVVIWPLTKRDLFSDRELTGLSVVKERHFQKLGFEVVKVPINVYGVLERMQVFLQQSLHSYLTCSR